MTRTQIAPTHTWRESEKEWAEEEVEQNDRSVSIVFHKCWLKCHFTFNFRSVFISSNEWQFGCSSVDTSSVISGVLDFTFRFVGTPSKAHTDGNHFLPTWGFFSSTVTYFPSLSDSARRHKLTISMRAADSILFSIFSAIIILFECVRKNRLVTHFECCEGNGKRMKNSAGYRYKLDEWRCAAEEWDKFIRCVCRQILAN